MGVVFNIVGCECSKKMEKQPSLKLIKVNDYTSSVLISSTIIPKELFKDKNQNSQNKNIEHKIILKNNDINVYEKYMQMDILGKSHYSKVYKVKNRLNGELRALKEISKKFIENVEDTKNIVFSINVLRKIEHPNLIRLYEFYEDENNFIIVYDLCENIDLVELIKEKKKLCEFLVKFIMYKVLSAVSYLHKQKIIHGDIKITNIGIFKKQNYNNTNINNINFDDKKEDKNIKELINDICDSIKMKNEFLIKDDYEVLSKKGKNFFKIR